MNTYRICLVLTLLLIGQSLYAQIRVEPSIGASFPLNRTTGTNIPFPSIGCKVKYCLADLPLAFGAEGAMNIAYRKSGAIKANGEAEDWALRNLSLLAVAEWHFFNNQKVRLFLGLGAGLALRHQTLPGFSTYDVPALGVCGSPTVGIYFRDRVFFALDTYITEKNFNTIGLRVGYSFGKRK